jgi:hypothetical protein
MTATPEPGPDRAERMQLAAVTLRGVLSGAARAIATLLLEEVLH